jgi:LPXTG-site transpeptidase (sortase) family protein
MKKVRFSKFGLFLGTFLSAFLLVFGVGTMVSTYLPILAIKLSGQFQYHPQLPLAEARDEDFLLINSTPAKQLFPALTNPTNVKSGNWFLIPAIGVDIPLTMSASLEDKDVLAALRSGAALYPNGILPGRLGNLFVSGHSSGTNVLQGPFALEFVRAGELVEGNEAHVDFEGTRYTYKLTHSEVVHPDPNFRVISDRPVPTLTLMTCTPIWTASKRLLQHWELTNITKLTLPTA